MYSMYEDSGGAHLGWLVCGHDSAMDVLLINLQQHSPSAVATLRPLCSDICSPGHLLPRLGLEYRITLTGVQMSNGANVYS